MNVKHPDRLTKADRLNYIVSRMRVQQGVTPTDLAAELHVSERTVYRDMRFLQKRETLKKRYSRREGRYVFETELVLPPLTLTPSEAVALYSAASNPALADNNFFASDLRAGLAKISASLRPKSADPKASQEPGADSLPSLSTDSLQLPTMEMIRRAMRSNRKLRIRYWSSVTDSECALSVAPFDLRQVEDNWYLLARADEQEGIRTFKISRVRAVEISNDRFRFPRNFSADEAFTRAWEASGNRDTEVVVQVRFASSVAGLVADSRGKQFDASETQTDGSLLCTAVVNSVKEIGWWILSFGSAAEVLSPPELRAEFAQTTRAMAALYADVL